MQKPQENQSIEQQIYIKSRLIQNLQNYLVDDEKKKESLIKRNPQYTNLFLKEQQKLKIHGHQNKPLDSLAAFIQKLDKKLNI
ncbi:unnamed protein product (macronuclear) [Paramecium tetraurelia]|uniref:Uncharacterized protein n=1 Tax=Paramecium tetraurelia TaxID=5888 RepID=A0C5V4_PARTE|nr:uncharacterized protein GSPATT00035300001 [Paramecium tetraurelia]CAK66171.1 unnamed protein product [Paramecium tetraurelia]|eukprot:XP_001433568.1 hypothetical protein (macronuclear) [Paramecium tetraurelia strain d4-2]